MQDIMEEIRDELSYNLRDKEPPPSNDSPAPSSPERRIPFLGIAIGVLVLLLLWALLGRGGKISEEDLAPIHQRLDRIEERLSHLDGLEEKVGSLDDENKGRNDSTTQTDRSVKTLKRQLNELNQKLARLEKKMALASKKQPGVSARPGEKPTKYHEVAAGESLWRIAQQYGLKVDELCELNGLDRGSVLKPGQQLLVSK
jgi:LysM repeat protein